MTASVALTAVTVVLADEQSGRRVEEVVVTARYVDEAVHDLPFTVNVIEGESLQERRLLSLEEALRTAIGVDVSSFGGFNDTNVRIRGLGSLFQINSEDSSVVLNVDGVPLSSRSSTLASMDIERVEILKGPQGTLFGRNSEAGAINITTRRPTRELEGYLRGEGGEEDQHVLEAALGGPLGDKLSGRVAVRNSGADSVINNSRNRAPALEARDRGARGSLMWEPSDKTTLFLVSERQEQTGRAGLEVRRPYTEPPSQDVTPGIQFGENVQDRHSLEINRELSGARFTSLTSQTRNEAIGLGCQSADIVNSVFGFPQEICQFLDTEYDSLHQDLRFASPISANLFWIAGANITRVERRYDNVIAEFGTANDRWFETDSEAVYGELSFPLTRQLTLTTGLRVTQEDKEYRADFYSGGTSIGHDERTLSDSYGTGRVALAYALNERLNFYGIAARGYKTGGFTDYTTQIADGEPLRPAKTDSIELGLKRGNTAGTMDVNVAVFLNEAKDDHLLGYDPLTFASQGLNTDVDSQGVELEATWRVSDEWAVTSGVGYTDAEIKRDVIGVSGGDVRAGNDIPDTAPWSALAVVEYTKPLTSFGRLAELRAMVSYRFLDKRAADPQNHFYLPANRKVDVRVALSTASVEFSVWGDNVLDERNELYGYFFAPEVTVGMPARGRTLGLGAAYRF